MAFTGAFVGGDDNQNGAGGPASAFGSSKPYFGKSRMSGGIPGPSKVIKAVTNPFHSDNAGKLSKSASTRSESLARLRGKGALA